ncbi:hypothetical protein M407DRAFT_246298 [Tulasnella calospora MUT 4182]|uniref:Uncharacterized protein n=1 Tax=Tulasnella calospora MUT 4182 TaxID=1051891 RepID=A0A0C3LC59_9AGAM|nr:hypothetical protein M407DRAFT_246298 [Tulasnella calospora MUT 4182]
MSVIDRASSGTMTLFVVDGTETQYPRWGSAVCFSSKELYSNYPAECFFDPI